MHFALDECGQQTFAGRHLGHQGLQFVALEVAQAVVALAELLDLGVVLQPDRGGGVQVGRLDSDIGDDIGGDGGVVDLGRRTRLRARLAAGRRGRGGGGRSRELLETVPPAAGVPAVADEQATVRTAVDSRAAAASSASVDSRAVWTQGGAAVKLSSSWARRFMAGQVGAPADELSGQVAATMISSVSSGAAAGGAAGTPVGRSRIRWLITCGDAVAAHGHAVQGVGGLHGELLVGDDDQLRGLPQLGHQRRPAGSG